MHAPPPRKSPRFLDVLGLIATVAIGVALGTALRPVAPPTGLASNDTESKAALTTAVARKPIAPADATAAHANATLLPPVLPAPVATMPTALPPPNQDAAKTYAELAPRARAGDAKAARRLAEDLQQCAQSVQTMAALANDHAPLADMSEESLAQLEAMQQRLQAETASCDGVTRAQALEAADWLRQAALNGDAEAALCSALDPVELRSLDFLSPAWRRHAQRWREEAPAMAERALFAGVPEAANLLASMNSALGDFSGFALRGLLGDHPDRAYLYARIYLDRAAGGMQARAQSALNEHAARLDGATRAALDAQARALEARIAFMSPAWDQRNPSLKRMDCRRLRVMTGMTQ